jgi:DNA-binding beta-propeller fold protein YncE
MHLTIRAAALAAAALTTLAGCTEDRLTRSGGDHPSGAATAAGGSYEVWLVDQSNTNGLAHGGTIHIYDGADLAGDGVGGAVPAAVIDLGGATSDLCVAATGALPVRPHMILFNRQDSHGVLSFVASGHVVVFDAASRAPVACLRASVGAGGARQAHAAVPSMDGSFILVANQNGKLLERIEADYATNTFTLNSAATLDLAGCTTPNGMPCEAPALRPDNAPICPLVPERGDVAYVTLRGGGMFVVDPRATPMAILAEYDLGTVHPNGCGGVEAAGQMWLDSGGGTPANMSEFDVYRFPLGGFAASNPPNVPARTLVFSDDATGDSRDAHGMVATPGGRHVWVTDRVRNVIEIFGTAGGRRVNTLRLVGPLSDDPSPDLLDIAPDGGRIFVSLRGPNPLSGDPHVSTGSTPGLGVIQVNRSGSGGMLRAVIRVSNFDSLGVERADPHGVRVRRK